MTDIFQSHHDQHIFYRVGSTTNQDKLVMITASMSSESSNNLKARKDRTCATHVQLETIFQETRIPKKSFKFNSYPIFLLKNAEQNPHFLVTKTSKHLRKLVERHLPQSQLGRQGYAYPQDPTEPPLFPAAISPTSALELVGAPAPEMLRELSGPERFGRHVSICLHFFWD